MPIGHPNPCVSVLLALAMSIACVAGCQRKTSTVDSKDPSSAGSSNGAQPGADESGTDPADGPPESARPLKVLGEVPPFSLIDQGGQVFQRSQLDGKLWVATFIFTRCGATCPYQTAAMTELQNELRSQGNLGRVELVTFTVDPGFDTPAVLAQYGRQADADFDHWKFLTGERGDLWDLSKHGFKLAVESARDDTTLIHHSQFLILVDDEAKIRGFYAALSEPAKAKLQRDIATLLEQQLRDRANDVTDIAYPVDVRAPQWLASRAEAQRAQAVEYAVNADFQFEDQREASGIDFKDEVVDDVKRDFKAAHYDHGSGIAVADVDQDGLLDLYIVSQFGSSELYRNLGAGKFENVTASAGVEVSGAVSVGASFADIDNDGDADLYVTRVRAPNQLFLNDGNGRFENVSATAGVDHVGHSSASVFFDYDRDGLLDLLLTTVGKYTIEARGPGGYYLAYTAAFSGHLHPERAEENILYRNLGEGRFENVNAATGFQDMSWSGDATPIDANEDGWPDIYLLNMQGHDQYFENLQGEGFVNRSRELFPATPWGTMGVKVFDYNRDGRLDLYVTDMHTDMVYPVSPDEEKLKMRRNLPLNMLATDGNHILGNAFFEKTGPDAFTEVSDAIGAENHWPWGISVGDLNADGFEDAFVSASMSYDFRYGINSVLLNENGQRFRDSEFLLGIEPRSKGSSQLWMELDCNGEDADHHLCKNRSGKLRVWTAIGTRSSVIFDLDGDGDLDIVTNDFGGTPMVLVSNLQEKHEIRYLAVNLVGTSSNRDGLGAQVEVHVGGRKLLSVQDGKSGYLSQSRAPLYFGLGESADVDQVVVNWPSGHRQVVMGPIDFNQLLTITEDTESTP